MRITVFKLQPYPRDPSIGGTVDHPGNPLRLRRGCRARDIAVRSSRADGAARISLAPVVPQVTIMAHRFSSLPGMQSAIRA